MNHNWSNLDTGKLTKYASHFVKMNFIAANCEIFENETGSKAYDFVVKNEKDQYVDVLLKTVYIEKTNYAYIPKYYWNKELRQDLYVALVLFMDDHEPVFYLIPSVVWKEPNDLFIDNPGYSRKKPEWGINVTVKTIPILAEKYWFDKVLSKQSD